MPQPNSSQPPPSKLHSFKSLLNPFRKRTSKSNSNTTPRPPKVTHYRNLSTQSIPASPTGFAPPNLGDEGWGENNWENVRPDRVQTQDATSRAPSWRSSIHDEHRGTSAQRDSNTGSLAGDEGGGQRSSGQSLSVQRQSPSKWSLSRASFSPLPQTPPRRTSHASSLPSTPAHRCVPSTISQISSARSRTGHTSGRRSTSGSSFTAAGVNVKSSRGSDVYTSQGVRIASDGYVGRWQDPVKEGSKGEVEVWRGHPALQARPGGGN